LNPSAAWLAARSILWALLLPGVVTGYIPWRFFGLAEARVDGPGQIVAVVIIAAGATLLAACIREFARQGGTLSPVDPPKGLVVQGLYRYVRNPMYLSVTTILLGEALLIWSGAIALYWLAWFGVTNLFVLAYEEPHLRRQFGASYDEYTRKVG